VSQPQNLLYHIYHKLTKNSQTDILVKVLVHSSPICAMIYLMNGDIMKAKNILVSLITGACLFGMSTTMASNLNKPNIIKEKSPAQWASEHVREEYAPNLEITGDYDKNLAVKCQNGIFVGFVNGDVLAYKGIPYATQPVGELRWKRPKPPAKSNKVFQALHNGKASIQPYDDTVTSDPFIAMGEDCLALNVFVNKNNPAKKKPVMVWIHGGAWATGSTSEPLYDGKNFVTNNPDVILVTINYRLGVLGFANFANIKGGHLYKDKNLGILDQIAALKWVKKNISAFGGDPDCVTVFGESAGGGSVSVLAIHPEAKGLFRRAIIQSGSVALTMNEKDSTIAVDSLAKYFKANNMDDLLAISANELKDYWDKYCNTTSNFVIAEQNTITNDPFKLWEKGATKHIDIMQGVLTNEWRIFSIMLGGSYDFFNAYNKTMIDCIAKDCKEKEYFEAFAKYMEILKKRYGKWADTEFITNHYFTNGMLAQASYHARNGGKGYVYVMNQPMDLNPELKACHGMDLYFVFGNFDGKMMRGTVPQQELAANVQKMWVNFAKTGNPSTDEYKWPEYTEKERATMIIGPEIYVENDPDRERRELTEKMRKYNHAYRYPTTLTQATVITMQAHPELLKSK